MEAEIQPQGNRIMSVCLLLLGSVPAKSSVPEIVFSAVGALANALEQDFFPYMEAFAPFLYKGLDNQEEAGLCSMSVGLVSDITRALAEKVQPWCDDFMNRLLTNLQSQALGQQFKPAILQCFGDIAQAINGKFEPYLAIVIQVLQQAASVKTNDTSPYEMHEYVISLREGIVDAFDGIIIAMMVSEKTELLAPIVEPVFNLIHQIFLESNRSEALYRSCMGVVGDLSRAFPKGEIANYFRQDWLTQMAKEIRSNKEFSTRTQDTARWAREQIKRQTGELLPSWKSRYHPHTPELAVF
jgi:importin subunit beta-1